MTNEEIEAAKARAEAATAGPFCRTIDKEGILFVETDQENGNDLCCIICTASPYPVKQLTEPSRHIADMDFIAAARTDVPRLADECLRRGERIAELERELRHWFGCPACGERHDGMCPPHEVRTTGQAWFYRALSEAKQREGGLQADLATARDGQDEAERQLAACREALEPFAEVVPSLVGRDEDETLSYFITSPTVGSCRKAAAVLAATKGVE